MPKRNAIPESVLASTFQIWVANPGRWNQGRKCKGNEPLIAQLRAMWRALQRSRPGELELRHVRAHVRVPGNELADWLADQGRYAFGLTAMSMDK